jgi:predicted transcriptional regulator
MEAKEYLSAIRATGLTQVQVAERTGIPQPTISKIERGDVNDVLSKNYRALQSLHIQVCEQAPQVVHATPLANPAQTATENVATEA